MPAELEQDPRPRRKVGANALGGAVAAIVAWGAAAFAGTDVPPGVEGAVATVVGFIVAYFVPERQWGQR